jgi:hypothetical protein
MDFYSIFFWWLMGAISGAAITAFLFGNFIVTSIKKGEMKMKDKNGEWISK